VDFKEDTKSSKMKIVN